MVTNWTTHYHISLIMWWVAYETLKTAQSPNSSLPLLLGGGLQHFSVSPRPLGFWVLGLRVWGQGLTIVNIFRSNVVDFQNEDEMTLLEWKRWAIALEAIVELAKPLYMGREEAKSKFFLLLSYAAIRSNNSVLLERALDGAQELAEKTGLEAFIEDIEIQRPIFQSMLKTQNTANNEEMNKEDKQLDEEVKI